MKRPDIKLHQFLLSRDSPAGMREQVLMAYGMTADLLKKLVAQQEEKLALKEQKKGSPMVQESLESDDEDL